MTERPHKRGYVSTGSLPPAGDVQELVQQAYERYRDDRQGQVSDVYPALSRVAPDLFGICVADVTGRTHVAGDHDVEFTIMSVAKPFTLALVCHEHGVDTVRTWVGLNATGLPFNSVEAVERTATGRTNPMVNAGAIATASLVPGDTPDDRWTWLLGGLSRFAGRELQLDEEVFASASETNLQNRRIAAALDERGALACSREVALELYTRQSSLAVTARDLAVMGATLADGGVNPVTREQVVGADSCRSTLAVMATAGLYETSGDWLVGVGLPGKSGIGGGLVTVSPGKGALGTFAPLLDEAGNSIKGRCAATFLSRAAGLDLFASEART